MPVLKNGMANTEKNMHALQASFGALCVKNSLSEPTPVNACVIVVCTDGAKIYWPCKNLMHSSVFEAEQKADCLHSGIPEQKRAPKRKACVSKTVCTKTPKFKQQAVPLRLPKLLRVPSKNTAAWKHIVKAAMSVGWGACKPTQDNQTDSNHILVFENRKNVYVCAIISEALMARERQKAKQFVETYAERFKADTKSTSPVAHIPCFIEKSRTRFSFKVIGKPI